MRELRPLLPFAALALGIGFAPNGPSADVRAVLSALALLASLLAAREGRVASRRSRALGAAGLGLSLYLAGGVATVTARARDRAPMTALAGALGLSAPAGRIVRIEGILAEDPRSEAGRTSARIEATRFETAGRTRFARAGILGSWPSERHEEGLLPLAGRSVEATLRLRSPRSFGNPGSADAAGPLYDRGILAFGFAKSARLVNVRAADDAPSPRRWLVRRFEAIFQRLFPDPHGAPGSLSAEGAVLRASVLGGRIALPAETERALVASGIYHILAVSGLQVAVFGGSVIVLLRRAPLPSRMTVLAAGASVLLYAEIVAPSASVQRAALTAAIAAAAGLLHRRAAPVPVLGVSAGILLALHPFDLEEAGFQLTFAATAAILVFAGRLAAVLPARWGLSSLLAACLAAQAATAPIVAVWFHRFVPFGIVSNLLAVPLGSLAVVLGIALLPADMLSHRLAALLGTVAEAAVRALLAIAAIPVEGTILSFHVAEPAPAALAIAAAALVLVAVSRRPAAVRTGIALTVLCHLWIACAGWWPVPDAARIPYGDVGGDGEDQADRPGGPPSALSAASPEPIHGSPPRPGGNARAADRGTAAAARAGVGRGGGPPAPAESPVLAIDMIDVGQGDAILVQFPGGETMLVDGGGIPGSAFDVGERVVLPELLRRGLRRIGRVVLTHAHEDHGGGLREVLKSLRVDEIMSPDSPQGPLRDELESLARAQGARVLRIRRGYTIVEGRTSIECLAPRPGEEDGVNAGSIVLRLVHGERSVLLTGDIGAGTERGLLARGMPKADVLKVAHHGSRDATGERFLAALHPRIAVISAGAGNRFDHPSPQILSRLLARRIVLLRTDRDGAIRVATDGRTVRAGSLRPDDPMPFPGPPIRARLSAEDDDLQREGNEREDEDRGAKGGDDDP